MQMLSFNIWDILLLPLVSSFVLSLNFCVSLLLPFEFRFPEINTHKTKSYPFFNHPSM